MLCLKCALIIGEASPHARDLLSPAQTDVLSMRCNGTFHGASSLFTWSFSTKVPLQSTFFFYIYFLVFFLCLNALASPVSISSPLENICETCEMNGCCENVKKKNSGLLWRCINQLLTLWETWKPSGSCCTLCLVILKILCI